MKKIILILLLILNIGVYISADSISIKPVNSIYAQKQRVDCPKNVSSPGSSSSGGGGFFGWLGDKFNSLGGAIEKVVNSIGNFFKDPASNGEGPGDENNASHDDDNNYGFDGTSFEFDPDPSGGDPNPWDDSSFDTGNWGGAEWSLVNNLSGYLYYYNSGTDPYIDCQGVPNGNAYIDYCGNCVVSNGCNNDQPETIDIDYGYDNHKRKDTIKTVPRNPNDPCPTDNNLTLTKELIKKMYPNASNSNTDSAVKYLNLYMSAYQINTRLRLAHFLAQILVETGGFKTFSEAWAYKTKDRLLEYFEGRGNISADNAQYYLNCKCLFNLVYAQNGLNHTNGDSTTGDGFRYRGRGFIHLTHKDSYYKFTKYYQNTYNDFSVDFEKNPDLLETNMKFGMLAALWEFSIEKSKNINNKKHALRDADLDNIEKVTSSINGGQNMIFERRDALKNIKIHLCL